MRLRAVSHYRPRAASRFLEAAEQSHATHAIAHQTGGELRSSLASCGLSALWPAWLSRSLIESAHIPASSGPPHPLDEIGVQAPISVEILSPEHQSHAVAEAARRAHDTSRAVIPARGQPGSSAGRRSRYAVRLRDSSASLLRTPLPENIVRQCPIGCEAQAQNLCYAVNQSFTHQSKPKFLALRG